MGGGSGRQLVQESLGLFALALPFALALTFALVHLAALLAATLATLLLLAAGAATLAVALLLAALAAAHLAAALLAALTAGLVLLTLTALLAALLTLIVVLSHVPSPLYRAPLVRAGCGRNEAFQAPVPTCCQMLTWVRQVPPTARKMLALMYVWDRLLLLCANAGVDEHFQKKMDLLSYAAFGAMILLISYLAVAG